MLSIETRQSLLALPRRHSVTIFDCFLAINLEFSIAESFTLFDCGRDSAHYRSYICFNVYQSSYRLPHAIVFLFFHLSVSVFETSLLTHIPHPLVRQRLEFCYFGKYLLFVYSHILFSDTKPLCNLLYLGRKALKDLDKLVGR